MTLAFTVEKFTSASQLLKRKRRVPFLFVLSVFVALFAFKPLVVAAAEDTADPKQRAVETITEWIAEKEQLEASRIDVLASDRRFRVPTARVTLVSTMLHSQLSRPRSAPTPL